MDWNENGLRGKQFGGVFGEKKYEIDGNSGFFTTMRYTCEVNNINNVALPKPLLLNKSGQTTSLPGLLGIVVNHYHFN